MNEKEFLDNVINFIVKIRTENCVNEEDYDTIFNYLVSHRKEWEKEGKVPLIVFEACVDLLSAVVGGNIFLSESDQSRLSDMEEEIYGVLMGFE